MKYDLGPRSPKEGNTYKRYGGRVLTNVATRRLTTDTLRSSLANRKRVAMRTSSAKWPTVAKTKEAKTGPFGCGPGSLHAAMSVGVSG